MVGRHVEFFGANGGDRKVSHVVADGSVFERRHVVFRPEDAFLDWFGRLVRRRKSLDTLQNLERRFTFADAFEGVSVLGVQVDFLPRGAFDFHSQRSQ